MRNRETTGGQSYPLSYLYNLAGGLEEVVYPSGRRVKSCYDGAGRAKEVQDVTGAPPKSFAAVGLYAPHGAIQSLTLGNGVVEQTGFRSNSFCGIGKPV